MSTEENGPGSEAIADLKSAIRAVARGEASGDPERKRLIARADQLKHDGLVPDNWAADGSLKEKRETANDVFAALQGALDDAFEDADDYYYYVWVQDWDGAGEGDNPYRVIFSRGGDLYGAPFTWTDENKVVVDVDAAEKIRPITTYVARGRRRSVPEERRSAREEMRGVRETRQAPITQFEIREVPNGTGGSELHFEGYASVTCEDYEDRANAYEMEDWVGPWLEAMVRGCFTKTIREACDTCFVVNHTGVSMARTKPDTLKLAEDSTGLHVDARLNPVRSDVQILRAAVDDGAIDEMSFAFQVMRQRWSYLEENGEIDRRWITEVSLNKGDVSPVNYGANPHTGGTVSMRSAAAVLSGRGATFAAIAAAMREIRSGEPVSQDTVDLLSVFDSMDGEQRKLSEMLGLKLVGDEPPEPEPEERAASVLPLILPDYTTAARAALAAARR
jgi:HK97 family phage prohead protease